MWEDLSSFLYPSLILPFKQYMFLRRPLVACFALALGCGPIGTILILRRMSLMGDAISHAILPGAAVGFLLAGLSIPIMSLCGFIAGLAVALAAGMLSRHTLLREDATLSGFYLIALGIGVLLISTHGGHVDLMCVLLGTILSINEASLVLVASLSTLTLLGFAMMYRPLLLECYDPSFLKSVGGRGHIYHYTFLFMVVMNLVSAFQAIGTLMALGLMMLPAIAARFWAQQVWKLAIISAFFTFVSGYTGLLISYHGEWPSGPSIILVAGLLYMVSFIFGRFGSLLSKVYR